jgi:hypothetical protein
MRAARGRRIGKIRLSGDFVLPANSSPEDGWRARSAPPKLFARRFRQQYGKTLFNRFIELNKVSLYQAGARYQAPNGQLAAFRSGRELKRSPDWH